MGIAGKALAKALAGIVEREALEAAATKAAAGAAEKAVVPGITAYHGSPHAFDKFDLSKIGTGEGAQVYGHGLYFAENEATAKAYREALAGTPQPMKFMYGGKEVWGNMRQLPDDVRAGASALHPRLSWYKNPADPAILARERQGLVNTIANFEGGHIPMEPRRLEDARDALRILDDPQFSVLSPQTPGHTYEVNLGVDPQRMLDWDAPYSAQHPEVQNAIKSLWTGKGGSLEREKPPFVASTDSGDAIHGAIATTYGGGGRDAAAQAAAAQALQSQGVPGIKYRDALSRLSYNAQAVADKYGGVEQALPVAQERLKNAQYFGGADDRLHWGNIVGELEKPQTRNFVMFDPEMIKIMRRYAVPIGAGAGATGLVGQTMYSGGQPPPPQY